jgi:dTDP-4-dehydrorhamnose 3,5-epimerase-like enzyme
MKIINYKFKKIKDNRGTLIAIEEYNDVPIEIKRIYYIYDNDANITRGFHAHKNLEQILICLKGSCKIKIDNGFNSKIIELKEADQGLYIGPLIWREMYDFSKGTILLVLASKLYSEKDYIRNYKEFIAYVKKEGK